MKTFTEKEKQTLGQFANDHRITSSITQEKADEIKSLFDKYKKSSIQKDDVIVCVETGYNFGHIKVNYISDNSKPDENLKYEEGSYDYVNVSTSKESTTLFTDFSDTEPFNRQGGLYVPHSWSRLALVKKTDLYREFEFKYNHPTRSTCFPVWGFGYNSFWKSVKFGICVEEKNADIFIENLRLILNKDNGIFPVSI